MQVVAALTQDSSSHTDSLWNLDSRLVIDSVTLRKWQL